ncbi:MAG TPA: ATP-binding protein [Streptosporangiaceae bacterium]|nr:ATP-binding protein [Streptosporangiaceae bacterium]
MSEFEFVPATKEQAKARLALAGPSGSGKTWTGLTIATGLAEGGKIAVIDTERGSASKYSGIFRFDRLNMYRYDPRDLAKALAAAAKGGYSVVVIDSLSRFWSGAGGMLEYVDAAAKRSYGGNSFGGWKEARPIENDMIEAMLGYPGHVIVTMRTKTAYEITKTEQGKTVPVKIGLQPEQRSGIEYEFDVVGDMDLENSLTVSKSRCPELSGQVIHRPDAAVAEVLLAWLTDGTPAKSLSDYRDLALDASLSRADLQELYRSVKDDGKLAALVMDETGEMVTLHALITRKGAEAAKAELASRPAQDGAEPEGGSEPAA